MAKQVDALSHLADRTTDHHNPYFSDDDPTLPKADPRRRFSTRNNAFLCCDRIADDQLVARLFRLDEVREFVRQCLGLPALHLYRDPLAAFLVNIQDPGETFPWHFDTNEFTTSVLVQRPETGGVFEYAPQIRSPESENFGAVAEVLNGDHATVISLDMRPGDLQIFKGRYALHRVTGVEGARARHSAIFGYTETAGMIAKPGRVQRLFGRVHDRHLDSAETVERGDRLNDG